MVRGFIGGVPTGFVLLWRWSHWLSPFGKWLSTIRLTKVLASQEKSYFCTVFKNCQKSRIQYCERSELRLHFEWTKVNQKRRKWSILASFWKPKACGQTVLPNRSILIEQKLMENAKIENLNWESHYETFWVIFKHDATYVIETISMTLQRLSGNLRHF